MGSEIRKKHIPDQGVKKAPDPGSGSATMGKRSRQAQWWRGFPSYLANISESRKYRSRQALWWSGFPSYMANNSEGGR
jgi:hypothetical protein